METPVSKITASSHNICSSGQPATAEPYAIYDYLKIKSQSPSPRPSPAPTPGPKPHAGVNMKLPQIPAWLRAQLPPGVNAEELLAFMDPRQLAALETLSQMNYPPLTQQQQGKCQIQQIPPFRNDSRAGSQSRSPSAERKPNLQPQSKGENPSKV